MTEEDLSTDADDCVSLAWRVSNPNHCPKRLRDGDGHSVGACHYYLRNGICPQHGLIYANRQEKSKCFLRVFFSYFRKSK